MTMHRLRFLRVRLGLLLAAGMMLCCTVVAAADLEPAQGVLLLRNGQMIEGQISRNNDHYQVNLPYGEIRVRVADVEFCCRTLQEGYERKRAAIQVGNVQDHLELAQWCERHGLLDLAANELSAAAAIEPNHPMVAGVAAAIAVGQGAAASAERIQRRRRQSRRPTNWTGWSAECPPAPSRPLPKSCNRS